jgi:hypothetical protein
VPEREKQAKVAARGGGPLAGQEGKGSPELRRGSGAPELVETLAIGDRRWWKARGRGKEGMIVMPKISNTYPRACSNFSRIFNFISRFIYFRKSDFLPSRSVRRLNPEFGFIRIS